MFEKAARSASITYWLAVSAGAAWLAWVCFTGMPVWLALLVFPLALAIGASALAPLAAGAALVLGLVSAAAGSIIQRASRPSRSDA